MTGDAAPIALPPAHDHLSSAAPFHWLGGKGRIAHTLIPNIPDGAVYVEPYGGAASILFAKAPSPAEVFNDLDGRLVNLFRAFQDPSRFARLQRRLRSTLYARAEFVTALEILADPGADPDDAAWAFFVAHNQGFAGRAKTSGHWGRVFTSVHGIAETASRWSCRLNALERYHRRLMAVQIDNRCALDVIQYWDSADTVFYLDPPYTLTTRRTGPTSDYAHEVDDAHHCQLVELLLTIKGKAVLSGYDTAIYRPLVDAGWDVIRYNASCYAAGRVRGSSLIGQNGSEALKRVECLWCSPGAAPQLTLL